MEFNTNTNMEHSQTTTIPIIDPIDTSIYSIPGRLGTTSLDLSSIHLVQDIVLYLNNYVFDDKTKIIERRKSKKWKTTHHEEVTQEITQLWNATHLNDE
jgi:hypothetical protein